MNTSSSPISGIGSLLQVVAVVTCVTVGVKELPFVISIAVGAAIFEVGYICVRLPQIIGVWQRDGLKIVQLFLLQFIAHIMR